MFLNAELMNLLNIIEKMQSIHEKGGTCCDRLEEWKRPVYGWHNARFPPEYRQCCLSGKRFAMDASCDLYYVMACFYEKVTGRSAPHNFEFVRSWKSCILDCLKGWEQEEQKAVIAMIANCTKRKDKRIGDAKMLLRKDFMKTVSKKTVQ